MIYASEYQNLNKSITGELIAAYCQCQMKAYLLLQNEQGTPHEYTKILYEEAAKNKKRFIDNVMIAKPVTQYSENELLERKVSFIDVIIAYKDLQTHSDIIYNVDKSKSKAETTYIPILVIGTNKIFCEDKLRLAFSCYVLSRILGERITSGMIVGIGNIQHTVKVERYEKIIDSAIRTLRDWICSDNKEQPLTILNSSCSLCQFANLCKTKCEKSDHLSLLKSITTKKQIDKYAKKGIFTVNQLSFLYKPRRQRKRSRKPPSIQHNIELQALVLRTGRIYFHRPPVLSTCGTGIFLDIEGVPDRQYYYLIGIIVVKLDSSENYSFWAGDETETEKSIWCSFLNILDKYKEFPIYHYGHYEAKAISIMGKRYGTDTTLILERLINVNDSIYGKVYFPTRSNSLKDIGVFICATWNSSCSTGLESLVLRHWWEKNHTPETKEILISYNLEDCNALKMLVDFLRTASDNSEIIYDIDCFVISKKSRDSKSINPIHDQMELMLKFAHADYDKNKIIFRNNNSNNFHKKASINRTKPLSKYRRITKFIQIEKTTKCQKCGNSNLRESKKKEERIKIDLIFNKNGTHKSVIKYIIPYSYCMDCKCYIKPSEYTKQGRPEIYGHGFKILIAYQRVALRLPQRNISLLIEDLFNEKISATTIAELFVEIALSYHNTEKLIIEKLLLSPFLHVDETQVNIDNINQYVWVITDEKRTVYKYTKTREYSFIRELLIDYKGVLISDFYPGFDTIKCSHQKCLVHLIRDVNNDLWSNPFDAEFGRFVVQVSDFLVPIMETIQKYELKSRSLKKHTKFIDEFYLNTINERYKSSLCMKYQERFKKYKTSLFTFIDRDGIPWHNNPAENALRAILLRLDISKVLHESVINEYLFMLSIMQTCKIQNKSFLKFLLSKETDVDLFKTTKLRKTIVAIIAQPPKL